MPDAPTLLRNASARIDAALAALPGRYPAAPPRLIESIQYSLTAGGKRLRPALVFETARAARGDAAADGASTTAAALAIEMVHTFSLVHDDLPAMDDDDLRRGRPTNHKVFGEAMAILAGDAMLAMAFEVLATDAAPHAAALLARELAIATGPLGMIGGQVLDMAGEGTALTFDALKQVHALKTGALLTAACRMGAIAGGGDAGTLAAVTTFGRHVGLAFQIVDDLLDVTATPAQLGKATGKDSDRGKNTYPRLLGLDASRAEAAEQLRRGLLAIEPLGERAEGLRTIARFVVERSS
jgi:geranylgeranyl diphosphate synthase type II